MRFEEIFSVDASNMYKLLKEFPSQVMEAVESTKSATIRLRTAGVKHIVLTGMGGSAIGGDLLADYLRADLKVPLIVNRHYSLPAYVGRDTLLLVASYSGNTEETISSYREARRRKARVLCLTSGGKIAAMAKKARHPVIMIPGGYPPRAALGYSFFPLLMALAKVGLIKDKRKDIRETIELLRRKADDYASPELSSNHALQIAQFLENRIGVVYASGERLGGVATRWRGQIAENGKALMAGHVLPEMNHNEIVGWKYPEDQLRELQVIFLRDKGDNPRVQRRLELTKQIIAGRTGQLTEVWSEGDSVLARIFSLVYLADWVSYYLAILHREDPTPVKVIDYLKEELGKKP